MWNFNLMVNAVFVELTVLTELKYFSLQQSKGVVFSGKIYKLHPHSLTKADMEMAVLPLISFL